VEHFAHMGAFIKLLRQRELVSAMAHVTACPNERCLKIYARLAPMLQLNWEIPGALLRQLSACMEDVEGLKKGRPLPPSFT
jgi:hypothetical protein